MPEVSNKVVVLDFESRSTRHRRNERRHFHMDKHGVYLEIKNLVIVRPNEKRWHFLEVCQDGDCSLHPTVAVEECGLLGGGEP